MLFKDTAEVQSEIKSNLNAARASKQTPDKVNKTRFTEGRRNECMSGM